MPRTCPRKASPKIASRSRSRRKLIKGERFSQLLSGPLRGWVGGHIEVENAPAVMSQYQKHAKNLESNGRQSEEVYRADFYDPREAGPERGAAAVARRAECPVGLAAGPENSI